MPRLNDKRRITFEAMRRQDVPMSFVVSREIRSVLKAFEEKATEDGESINWATLLIESSIDHKTETLLVDMNIVTVPRQVNPFDALMLGLADAARRRFRQ